MPEHGGSMPDAVPSPVDPVAMEETVLDVRGRRVHATIGWPRDVERPVPGLVVAEGSGPSSRRDQHGWVRRLVRLGAAVLVHDKPGCGDTGGRWQDQTIEQRADETLAGVAHLAAHSAVDPSRVGLWGASQGGWVVAEAAARNRDLAVAIVVSAAGVSPFEQEVASLRQRMRRAGAPEEHVDRAAGWFRGMVDALRAGEDPRRVADRSRARRREPWAAHIYPEFSDPDILAFLARIGDFDPLPRLARIRAPLLAVWGGEDDLVPVARSRDIFERALREARTSAFELRVFPGADHNLLVGPPSDDPAREHPFVPGYLDAMAAWFRRHTRG